MTDNPGGVYCPHCGTQNFPVCRNCGGNLPAPGVASPVPPAAGSRLRLPDGSLVESGPEGVRVAEPHAKARAPVPPPFPGSRAKLSALAVIALILALLPLLLLLLLLAR